MENYDSYKNLRQSHRVLCKYNRNLRYSRINMGQTMILSKFSGLKLHWGITNK